MKNDSQSQCTQAKSQMSMNIILEMCICKIVHVHAATSIHLLTGSAMKEGERSEDELLHILKLQRTDTWEVIITQFQSIEPPVDCKHST